MVCRHSSPCVVLVQLSLLRVAFSLSRQMKWWRKVSETIQCCSTRLHVVASQRSGRSRWQHSRQRGNICSKRYNSFVDEDRRCCKSLKCLVMLQLCTGQSDDGIRSTVEYITNRPPRRETFHCLSAHETPKMRAPRRSIQFIFSFNCRMFQLLFG